MSQWYTENRWYDMGDGLRSKEHCTMGIKCEMSLLAKSVPHIDVARAHLLYFNAAGRTSEKKCNVNNFHAHILSPTRVPFSTWATWAWSDLARGQEVREGTDEGVASARRVDHGDVIHLHGNNHGGVVVLNHHGPLRPQRHKHGPRACACGRGTLCKEYLGKCFSSC